MYQVGIPEVLYKISPIYLYGDVTLITAKFIIYRLMVVVQLVMSLTSYIPQIIKLIKTKHSDDISLGSWWFSLIDFSTYQVLLILGNESLTLNILNGLQILQIIAVIVLVIRYRKKGTNNG